MTSTPESVALTTTSSLPPAELIAEPPLKIVMSMAVPPLWMKSLPPLEMRAPSSVPPARTVSVPPLKIVVGSATPPEDTTSAPPLDTLVSLATPPAETISVPPIDFYSTCRRRASATARAPPRRRDAPSPLVRHHHLEAGSMRGAASTPDPRPGRRGTSSSRSVTTRSRSPVREPSPSRGNAPSVNFMNVAVDEGHAPASELASATIRARAPDAAARETPTPMPLNREAEPSTPISGPAGRRSWLALYDPPPNPHRQRCLRVREDHHVHGRAASPVGTPAKKRTGPETDVEIEHSAAASRRATGRRRDGRGERLDAHHELLRGDRLEPVEAVEGLRRPKTSIQATRRDRRGLDEPIQNRPAGAPDVAVIALDERDDRTVGNVELSVGAADWVACGDGDDGERGHATVKPESRDRFKSTRPGARLSSRGGRRCLAAVLDEGTERPAGVGPAVVAAGEHLLQPHVQDDEEIAAAHLLQLQARDVVVALAPADGQRLVAVAADDRLLRRLRADYPGWGLTRSLDDILRELAAPPGS